MVKRLLHHIEVCEKALAGIAPSEGPEPSIVEQAIREERADLVTRLAALGHTVDPPAA